MERPTQDIGITSSFAACTSNDISVVTDIARMEGKSKCIKRKDVGHNHKAGKINNNNLEVSLEDTFPWIMRFNKIMCMAVGNKSYQVLDRLLMVYTQNILKSVEENQNIPYGAGKLKNHVNNTLTFFYFYWQDIKKDGSDCDLYLNKMSVLLGVFIDMELKFTKQDRNVHRITSKLLNMLWIYLDNSEEYILKVLLRIKLISKKTSKICSPIFKKCLVSLSTSKCTTDVAYVRYLLIYKIWQKMQVDDKEKKEICSLVLKKLGPRIPKMHPDLQKCISQSAENNKDSSIFLLESNSFDVESVRERLLLLDENLTKSAPAENSTHSQARTARKPSEILRKQNNKKEIIFIDLTNEENGSETHDSKKVKKKNKRKLESLQNRRKKQKPQNSGIQVQIVHSTQNVRNSSVNNESKHLPISDNQISESTMYSTENRKEQVKVNDDSYCKTCSKQDDIQHSRAAHLLKLLKLVIQTIKDSHVFPDLENHSKHGNHVTTQTHFHRNNQVKHSCMVTQDRDDSFSQDKILVNSMPLFTTCQNCISQMQTMKQESIKNDNYDAKGLYKDTFADLHKVECTLRNMACINKADLYGLDVQQKLPRNVNECISCYKRIHSKHFSCRNQTGDYTTESDKFICDKTIVNKILSDLDECINALNRIGERIVSVCTDKQQAKLSNDKSNEFSISTTISEERYAELQLSNATHDFSSSITDQLQMILEICNKNEFLNLEEIRSICGTNTVESTAPVNNVDISHYERQTVVSTSCPKVLGLKASDEQSVNCIYSNNLYTSQRQQEDKTTVTSTQTQFDDDFAQNDDFKTMDILKDVLEDSQSSLISSISNDNPASIFNYLNEDNELNEINDSAKFTKPLPERGLGTTGILNSLLDFDQINMDSALDEFMYSNMQTVNPRVIKKNLSKNPYTANKHDDHSEFEDDEQMLLFLNKNVVDLLPKDKTESCTNHNDPVGNSVDIVGFGLNSSKPEVFDLSTLEDEETDGRNMPSSLWQSPLSINSDIISSDLKDITSKYISISPIPDLNSDISIERSYTYTKEDTLKDFQSFSELPNKLPSKTCASKDVPMNLLTDCFVSEDPPPLSYNSISVSPVQFKECNWPLEQSLNASNPLLSMDSAMFHCEKVLESTDCSLSMEKVTNQCQEELQAGKQSIPEQVHHKSSHRKFKCIGSIKKGNTQSSRISKAKQETNLALPIIDSNSLDSNDIVSCTQKQRKRIYSTRKAYRQIKHIDLKKLGVPSSRKKQILLDSDQEDAASLFERNHENPLHGLQEDSDIVYELSLQCSSQQAKKKYVKIAKGRLNAENNAELSAVSGKCRQDVPNSILMKPKVRWFIRSVNTQTPLFLKKQKLKKVMNVNGAREDASMKKKGKFLSLSEKGVTTQTKSKHGIGE